MKYLIGWCCDRDRYYYQCPQCNKSQWCPDHIDFEAGYDTDSDVSYRISAQKKSKRIPSEFEYHKMFLRKVIK